MKSILLSLLTAVVLQAAGQASLSTEARIFREQLHRFQSGVNYKNGGGLPSAFIERYDLYPKGTTWMMGALVRVDEQLDLWLLESEGIEIQWQMETILSIRVPVDRFDWLVNCPGIQYIEAGSELGPDLERSRYSLRSDSVYMGLGDLMMPYTGKGVIIAIIDWGFDYTHPMFYDTLIQEYRISRAWDQVKTSGTPPAGYSYGAEYVGKDALLAAAYDTLYVFGPMSHGTHVGGIAGGGGAGTRFRGIAPEAELIFISLKRDDPSFIDAIKYVSDYANAVGKPFVVNMSFGNHSGPHDGSTLRNKALDLLAGKGSVFVASAGNNGGEPFHILHDFDGTDTIRTEIKRATGLSDHWGETVNIWAAPGAAFSVQLTLTDLSNQVLYSSNWYATPDYPSLVDTLYALEGDTLILRLAADNKNFLNNKPNLLLECRNLGNNKVQLAVAGTGETHLWHVALLNSRVTNWGQPFVASFPGAIGGDDRYSIGGPPAVSRESITVASHQGEVVLPNGSEGLGTISTFSSWGPTVDGRTKPDISGPGQAVVSSVNSSDPTAGSPVETVNFNGMDYDFVAFSGTSMSGPAVAGLVALMLQANPNLTAREVKDILRATARLDSRTGDIGPEGDLRWGWGKANAYAAVRMAELKLGGVTVSEEAPFHFYPNPVVAGQVHVSTDRALNLTLRSLTGVELTTYAVEPGMNTLDLSGLAPGFYLLEWNDGLRAGMVRVVVSE